MGRSSEYHGKIFGMGNAIRAYAYRLTAPVPGLWQYVLHNEGAAASDYFTWTVIDGPIRLDVATDREKYLYGETITVEASLLDGLTPLRGASVIGHILLADGSSTPLTFVDDGTQGDRQPDDGILTARGTAPAVSGFADVEVQATLGEISRMSFDVEIGIWPRSAQIGGVISATTSDADSDGLYDTLSFVLTLNVTIAGSFELAGALHDPQGSPVATASYSTSWDSTTLLAPGSYTVTLRFDCAEIRASGKDGPYTLDLTLSDRSNSAVEVDAVTRSFTTEAYLIGQFERP